MGKASQEEKGSEQPHNQLDASKQDVGGHWAAGGQGMNGFGFEGMSGGFPNMGFNNPADFNQMMQFMPNGAIGSFPNMMG